MTTETAPAAILDLLTSPDRPQGVTTDLRIIEAYHRGQDEMRSAYADLAHSHELQVRQHLTIEDEMKNRLGL